MGYGVAELPLHDGHVPKWMAYYMKRLAKAIVAVIVEEYGPAELVRRLADPFWFQAFNNAIGMDWDSSGSTTVTTGILRQVVDEDPSLGVVIVGGKGRLATSVPEELPRMAERIGLSSNVVQELIYASRIAAKTDNSLLQDGYTIYHHVVVVAENGEWSIIQQGMNTKAKLARRYHWSSPLPVEPTLEPHKAIASSRREDVVLDLTSKRSREARKTIIDIVRQDPRKSLREVYEAHRILRGLKPITHWLGKEDKDQPVQVITRFYKPQAKPPRNIGKVLSTIHELQPRSMEELLSLEGVGPAVIRSLSLVAELIYGSEASHSDPANTPLDPFRYAYVVGGKDGIPFVYNPELARRVIEFLEDVVKEARLGEREKAKILQRLRGLLPPTPYRSQR